MKKNTLILFLLWLLILSWCSKTSIEETKKDFLISTQYVSDFSGGSVISKPWKIVWSQEITVTAQANGRVGSIPSKEWDNVKTWQPVVKLNDDIAQYGLQLERAKNGFDRASLTYQQSKITLDKLVSDTEIWLLQAENTYNVSQQSVEQSMKKARFDLDNSSISTDSLKLQLPVEKNNILNILSSILHQSDTILGVTDKYKNYNDSYEIYLWAKDTAQKSQTESELLSLYQTKNQISNLPFQISTSEDIDSQSLVLEKAYIDASKFLDDMRDMLINTVSSTVLTQPTIDGYKASIDWQKTSLQIANSAFVGYRKQVQSSLSSGSVEIGKTNAQIWYDTVRISSENTLFSTELALKNAKINNDTAIKSREAQLSLLENAMVDAQISYQNAQISYAKLSVRSPIDGTIGSIFVDKWQEVWMWTPLFTVVSSDEQLVEVFVTSDENRYLKFDQDVLVKYNEETIKWKIKSISSVADKSMLYKVIVQLEKPVSLFGEVVTVILPINISNILLPINSVNVLGESSGFIYILQKNQPLKYNVTIWKTQGDSIEILSPLSPAMEIITSDISNYDKDKFRFKKIVD